jgi:hypothetical protein
MEDLKLIFLSMFELIMMNCYQLVLDDWSRLLLPQRKRETRLACLSIHTIRV